MVDIEDCQRTMSSAVLLAYTTVVLLTYPPDERGPSYLQQTSILPLKSLGLLSWCDIYALLGLILPIHAFITTIHNSMAPHTKFVSIMPCLHAIIPWKYLYLQEIVEYLKHLNCRRSTWTLPGTCKIQHRCFQRSTGCTIHDASDEIYTCLPCYSLCKPPTVAKSPPEVLQPRQ